jgi:hypothetical protein
MGAGGGIPSLDETVAVPVTKQVPSGEIAIV